MIEASESSIRGPAVHVAAAHVTIFRAVGPSSVGARAAGPRASAVDSECVPPWPHCQAGPGTCSLLSSGPSLLGHQGTPIPASEELARPSLPSPSPVAILQLAVAFLPGPPLLPGQAPPLAQAILRSLKNSSRTILRIIA